MLFKINKWQLYEIKPYFIFLELVYEIKYNNIRFNKMRYY